MMSKRILINSLGLSISLVMIGLGIFLMAIPYVKDISFSVITFFFSHLNFITLLGACFFFLGLLFFRFFYNYYVGARQLMMKVTCNVVSMDERVVLGYLQRYWLETFPGKRVNFVVKIVDTELIEVVIEPRDIGVSLKDLSSCVQGDFRVILNKYLGYKGECIFTISSSGLS